MNIYTFVADDGENTHIDSEGLRQWCIKNTPEIFNLPINYKLASTFIRDNIVSIRRCNELSLRAHLGEQLAPIIMIKDGTIGANGYPNGMLVDGHHRYYLHYISKRKYIEAYFLEVAQWKPFQLHGLPDVTKDQLKRVPITKRNY